MDTAITKRQMYKAMISYANGNGFQFENDDGTIRTVYTDEIIEFANNGIDYIDRKIAKAKEKSAANKDKLDSLAENVRAALSDHYELIADIAARIDDDTATLAKVTHRLSKLATLGIAEKTDITVPPDDTHKNSRTLKGYRLKIT